MSWPGDKAPSSTHPAGLPSQSESAISLFAKENERTTSLGGKKVLPPKKHFSVHRMARIWE